MTAEPDAARYRRWFGVYLLLVAAVSTIYGVANARRAGGWAIGEWLINYSAGFVRRGLPGEIVLLLGRATGLKLPWIVFVVQDVVYLIFLGCVFRLTRGLRWSWMMAALLLSPATLGFLVLDPPNGFKKEILLFATLAGLVCILLFGALLDWQSAVLLMVGCVCLVLSHEGMLVYLPYLFAAVAVRTGSQRRALRIAAWPAVGCALAGLAVLRHPGDLATAEKICTSAGGRLKAFGVVDDQICGGAIVWLQETFSQAHQAVVVALRVHHFFRLYVPLALLALAPAVAALGALYREGSARREVKIVAACSMIAFGASLLLFYSGRDWGRWIHIHAVCLMLLVLMLSRKQEASVSPVVARAGAKHWVAGCALAIYATCWTLPAVDIYPARFGYAGLYRYLRSYGPSHRELSPDTTQPEPFQAR